MKTYVYKRDIYENIDYSFICNNRTQAKGNKLERTQMTIRRKMDKAKIAMHTR